MSSTDVKRRTKDGTDAKLRVENLTKTFGEETAVDNLSFEIAPKQLKSLLGPSGCGKTTTLRCIAGFEQPDSGRISIDEEVLTDVENNIHVPPQERELGMVFQSYAIWPHMSVKENVQFPLKHKAGVSKKTEREQRIHDILSTVGLEDYIDDLATNLSGGQQQRVALARALIAEPEVMLFDEPLANLDAKLRRDMRTEIQRICDEHEITALYVTHSQDEAMYLSDEIAIMEGGTIVEEDTPENLYTNPQTFFGMSFMGHCNIFSGEISVDNGTHLGIDTSLGRFDLKKKQLDSLEVHDPTHICFRPKFCRLLIDDGASEEEEMTIFEGVIDAVGMTRDATEYEIDVKGTECLVRTFEPLPVTEGETIQIGVKNSDVRVFRRED